MASARALTTSSATRSGPSAASRIVGGAPFPAEPRRRADICFFLTNKYNEVVLAIVHPFRDERTVALGAATLYAEVKQQKYAAIVIKGPTLSPS